jgi:hypothetical protein
MKEPVGPPFRFRFKASEDEYVRFVYRLAAMYYRERKPRSKALNLAVWIVVWLALVALIGVITHFANRQGEPFVFAALLPFLALFLGALSTQWFIFWTQRQAIRGMVRGLPQLLDVEAELGSEMLRWQAGPYSFSMPLAAISQIDTLDKGLLVRAGLNGIYFPSHAFVDEQQKLALYNHLVSHLTPKAAAISVKGI